MNVGGGCGDPDCDCQVQCGSCATDARRQLNEWCDRVGVNRTMLRFREPAMYEQAHAEALQLNAAVDQLTS